MARLIGILFLFGMLLWGCQPAKEKNMDAGFPVLTFAPVEYQPMPKNSMLPYRWNALLYLGPYADTIELAGVEGFPKRSRQENRKISGELQKVRRGIPEKSSWTMLVDTQQVVPIYEYDPYEADSDTVIIKGYPLFIQNACDSVLRVSMFEGPHLAWHVYDGGEWVSTSPGGWLCGTGSVEQMVAPGEIMIVAVPAVEGTRQVKMRISLWGHDWVEFWGKMGEGQLAQMRQWKLTKKKLYESERKKEPLYSDEE